MSDSRDLATFNQRFVALVIDWIACTVLVLPFGRGGWASLWVLLLLIVWYAFWVGLSGQTLGMRLTRIECVDAATSGRIGIARAALRGVLVALLIPAVITDDYGRGLHDRWIGTVMLKR